MRPRTAGRIAAVAWLMLAAILIGASIGLAARAAAIEYVEDCTHTEVGVLDCPELAGDVDASMGGRIGNSAVGDILPEQTQP